MRVARGVLVPKHCVSRDHDHTTEIFHLFTFSRLAGKSLRLCETSRLRIPLSKKPKKTLKNLARSTHVE